MTYFSFSDILGDHQISFGTEMVHPACTNQQTANLQHPTACGLLPILPTQGVTLLRSLGKRTVSRTFLEPVSTISKRATPNPHPA